MAIGIGQDRIKPGMAVYSLDNEKLGKVIRCDASGFLLEKGLLFTKDYLLRYDHIRDLKGDDLHLDLTKAQLQELWDRGGDRAATAAPVTTERAVSTPGLSGTGSTLGASQEVRVPVTEEELEVRKGIREKGEVRIHKEVITETKQVSVPVTREEVRVERVPVDAPRAARPGEASFQGGEVRIPIREEEVEVTKRPVVKEEIRISKEAKRGEERVSEQLRKEKVDVKRGPAEEEEMPAIRRTETRESTLRAGGVPLDESGRRIEDETLRERSPLMPGSDQTGYKK